MMPATLITDEGEKIEPPFKEEDMKKVSNPSNLPHSPVYCEWCRKRKEEILENQKILVGKVYSSNTYHVVDRETERSECNMVAMNEEAAEETNSGAIISKTREVETVSDIPDEIRVCSHCIEESGVEE